MNHDGLGRMMRLHPLLLASALWVLSTRNDADDIRRLERPVGDELLISRGETLAERADSMVRAGHPWRATVLLSGRLAAPENASPDQVLMGARAAAGWGGWNEVERLLRPATWLDQRYAGEGRELLARSALERNADALPDARLAVQRASSEQSRAVRLVLLARAQDRANAFDSASASYLAAAMRLPLASDWLRLRAAGVVGDSSARAALFARLTSPVARARIIPTDAQARERSKDYDGAARQYRRAGLDGAAFRVEALAAADSNARAALASRIVARLAAPPPHGEVRQTLDVLDKLGPITVSQELVVARAAANAGIAARAITGFSRVAAAAPLAPDDEMSYAAALSRAGRFAEAARAYASVTPASALAPAAAYQQARTLVQAGDGAGARDALRGVLAHYAGTRDAEAPALLLLADLQVDDGELDAASHALREVLAKYPNIALASVARFRLGLIEWNAAPAAAAATFDSLSALSPTSDEGVAARYWAGRALERMNKRLEAESRWRKLVQTNPLSYYAMLAAARLHVVAWTPPAGPDSAEHLPVIDSAVGRVTTLQRLGMDVEARLELDALAARADRSAAETPAVAQALLQLGDPARALRVALAAIEHGSVSRSLLRVAYPLLHGDALVEESKRNGLDPALVAGLIRQESSWNPRAVSIASARGLMQLLPSVGAAIASSRKYPLWNPALLFDPDVSLELGTSHFASSLKRDTPPARALAAYNAGASRVTRWTRRPGSDDPELFTEWIPFTETRDYVRIVQRNAEVYRALYQLH